MYECAIVGYDDAGLVLPRAYVVPTTGSESGPELAEELKLFVRSRLSPPKYPRDVRFLEQLPRTASGKLDRGALTSSEPVREHERG